MNLGVLRCYRPSMLLAAERKNLCPSEAAWITIFTHISPYLGGPLRNWKGITPRQVAWAMVNNVAIGNCGGVFHHEHMTGTSDEGTTPKSGTNR